jgi:hypothetical protein
MKVWNPEGVVMSLTVEEYMAFCRNRAAFDDSKLLPYQGEWVAFNREGNEVLLSSAVSDLDAYEQLRRRGLDPSDHLVTYVPHPNDVIEGGFFVSRFKGPVPGVETNGRVASE